MVFLINPPDPQGFVSNKDTMGGFGQLYTDEGASTLPPLDIPYIGAVLKKNDIPVKIYDCSASALTADVLIDIIKKNTPKILGVRTSTPTVEWDLGIIKKIKNECTTLVVMFGPHATLFEKDIIANKYVDAIILGEPEFIFTELVQKNWKDIEGVVYKSNGEIHRNLPARFIKNLDSLPFPAWELMPMEFYSIGNYLNNQTPFFTILSSRGCPFGCKYCPYPISQGKKWRARSVKNVLDEIQYLIDKFNMKGLLFRDPEFTINSKRVANICEEIIEKELKFSWRCETRLDTVNERLLTLMARAGCIGINFGIENASESVLKKVGRKNIAKEDIINIVSICKKLSIDTFCFFVIGFPDDNVESIIDTIDFSFKLAPTSYQFTIFTPYPGTELRTYYEQNGLIEDKNFKSLTSYKSVVRTKKFTSAELQKFSDFAYQIWDMFLIQRGEIKSVREELERIKSTRWYKVSFKVYSLWKNIKKIINNSN